MKGTIIKIHPINASRSEGAYIRIELQLEDGSWAKTDVVTRYRNYARWRPIIGKGKGTTLGNLVLRKTGEIDADSFPTVLNEPIVITKKEEPVLQDRLI